MILKIRIIVKNYKCFDSSGGGFDSIFPINIIIGKNNSGKSSLIDLIQFVIQKHKAFIEIGRDNSSPEVLLDHNLSEQEIARVFPPGTRGGGIPANNFFEYGKTFINKTYTYSLGEKGTKSFVKLDADFVKEAQKLIDDLAGLIPDPFANKLFCNISSERDIIPEIPNTEIGFLPNGSGATNFVQQIIKLCFII